MGDSLLTIKDVAKLLACTPRGIQKWLDREEFPPPLKLGRLIRWRREDIERWLEAKARQAQEQHLSD